MISFGAASGWMTLSGCGSKVSTVSAPSITLRWPTWTPSKVPIATSRGRGSASGSGVTLMLIARELCSSASRRASASASGHRRRLVGLLDAERADRGAAQLGSRRRRGRDQAADVGARRALDLELGRVALAAEQLGAVDGHDPRRHLDLLAAARPLVGALAADLDRRVDRRALADLAGRQLELARASTPVSVISPSGSPVVETRAEARGRTVGLRQAHEARLLARRRRPSRTISRPVANGSSVPAWPTLHAVRALARATTSCEVTPAGLSTSRRARAAGVSRAGPRPRARRNSTISS